MKNPNKLVGILASLAIFSIVASAVLSLFFKAEFFSFSEVFEDSYIWRVVYFSLYQATLSTLFSILFAIPVALAFYRRNFLFKRWLLRVFSVAFVLPSLIGVFGIVAIYGNSGFINEMLGEKFLNIYGLSGILLAHIFFNAPLAIRIFYQSLSLIDTNQHKLSTQLGLSAYEKFRHLEFPIIKQEIPQIASLIFMLCFTSFAVVMALGGGPKSTTIEVAIYQAIKYDFDLNLAALLSVLQILICIFLTLLVQKFSNTLKNRSFYDRNSIFFSDSLGLKISDFILIILSAFLVLPPIIAIILSGINQKSLTVLQSSQLLKALLNSISIAFSSAILSMFLAICIILASRAYKMEKAHMWATFLELGGTIILIAPSIVISTGLFILLNPFVNVFDYVFYIVVVVNSLMALPFIIRSLSQNFFTIEQEYQNLCKSLGIGGVSKLFLIEFKALRKPLLHGISLSFVLSLGDLSAIALFGSWDFKTLPLLLFEQMGSYDMDGAAVSALVLLVFCFLSFGVIELIFAKRGVHVER